MYRFARVSHFTLEDDPIDGYRKVAIGYDRRGNRIASLDERIGFDLVADARRRWPGAQYAALHDWRDETRRVRARRF